MSERKCVELTATFDDGTVMRWDEHDEGADLGAYILLENEGKLPAFRMESRAHVSHPLRKVTVVRAIVGVYEPRMVECGDFGHRHERIGLMPTSGDKCHETMMQSQYDARVTVEAVPVKGGKQ